MPFARQETALSAIADTMGQMGLAVPTTIVGNTEKTVAQFLRLANSLGQQLAADEYKWQFLEREFTITTVIGQAAYDVPEDLDSFVNDANWNRTSRLPIIGSLTQQEWQMLKARLLTGTTFTVMFVMENNQIVFYDTPSAIETIVMPYTSRGWCTDSTGLVWQDSILADTDIILYDPQLFKVGLKLAWYSEKQFDTTKLQKTYNSVYSAAKGKDAPGRTLSLSGTRQFPYLGAINVPDTGFGS